jgi:phage shock protein A
VGISEQARNITDTSLKLVISASDDPANSLKQHVLRLESALRDLSSSEELLAKQCAWLSTNIERNLKQAESDEARAARLLQLDRQDDARQALSDKRDALIQVTSDRRRLLQLESSLPGLREQIRLLKARIDQARSIRTRLVAGEPLSDQDLHRPPDSASSVTRPPVATPENPETFRTDRDLDRELDRLRRRLDDRTPEDPK